MKPVLRSFDRLLAGALAGVLVALAHALVASMLLAGAGGTLRDRFALVLSPEVPIACVAGLLVALAAIVLEPGIPSDPIHGLQELQAEPMLERTRLAAKYPLVVVVGFVWFVAVANVARLGLSLEPALLAGRRTAWAAGVVTLLAGLAVLALTGPLRAFLARHADRRPWLVNPLRTTAVALAAAAILATAGAWLGGPGGDRFGALGILGVVTRAELDLSPVTTACAVALVAYVANVAAGRRIAGFAARGAAAIALLGCVLLAARGERTFDRKASLAAALATGAPSFRLQLQVAQKVFDRDHDGASSRFGGGDCNDADRAIGPDAIDIPGNGIDEDCSGKDALLPSANKAEAAVDTVRKIPDSARPWGTDVNVLFITIDTLRFDESETPGGISATPNLDALAARGTKFTRAYSLASYTGKSIGPMMIGRYPSETDRDGGHFNHYGKSNVMLAERLKKQGFRTLGGAAMNYFSLRSGLARGFDVWDLSARPKHEEGATSDQDTSVTSAALTTAALRMLRKQADPQKKNFMWLHYSDPHAQYVEHRDAPDFLGNHKGGAAMARARYDAEVWATDKEVGRVIAALGQFPSKRPWVVIVTSDHGEAFNDHGMSWHGMDVWESLVRVPLIIAAPGMTAHVVDKKRSHIDLVPTVLDLIGAADTFDGPGKSLLIDLVDGANSPERDVLIDMPTGPYTQKRRALLFGPSPGMKFVAYPAKRFALFDLAADPAESQDLVDDAVRFDEAKARFEAAEAELHEVPPTTDPEQP
jgi:arylsulfatase A-like enzyme